MSNSRCLIVLGTRLEVRKSANVVSVGLFRKYSLLIDEIEPARKFKRFWAFVALTVPSPAIAGFVFAMALGPVVCCGALGALPATRTTWVLLFWKKPPPGALPWVKVLTNRISP